jgi:hypothetical protein
MNAVEIEEAVSRLAEAPFDPEAFPFAFLEAFDNKLTTLKKLQSKSGSSNQSDLPGGVLQRNNIHLKVCSEGEVTTTLSALRDSPATTRYKAKFILATDGKSFEAENLVDGETVACDYPDFHDHFGFFLPLAGITTVKQIRENAFDIKATGRLNRLYIELLKDNPDWDKAERREELNHFMARLIFCFFAEDTNIFHSEGLFTATVGQMSDRDSSNTHEVLSELFRAMCTPINPITSVNPMDRGNSAIDGGDLLLTSDEVRLLRERNEIAYRSFIRLYLGSEELINGKLRFALWISDDEAEEARKDHFIAERLEMVRKMRAASSKQQTRESASWSHRFGEIRHQLSKHSVVVPRVSSENREFLPVGLGHPGTIIGDRNFALYDAPLWNMALIASRIHLVWIATVCGKLETRYRYSNTLGWNTFPVPTLTNQNKTDLTRCAEDILLAREAHFPATLADLYNPDTMPENLRQAHDRNDEILERIYIGRRFKNDTERLEKLFELYTKMTSQPASPKTSAKRKGDQ